MTDPLQSLIALGKLIAMEADNSVALADLEAKARLKFPPLFRALLANYQFEPFVVQGVEFFGNSGTGADSNIAVAMFDDQVLSPALLQAKLLQVGRPYSGLYDPVCFDLNTKAAEPKLVQVDHESILSFGKLKIAQLVARSFPALIEAELTSQSPPRHF